MYALLYFKWITNKVLLYSTRNSAQWHVTIWMGREFRGGWMHTHTHTHTHTYINKVVIAKGLSHAVHLKLSQPCG